MLHLNTLSHIAKTRYYGIDLFRFLSILYIVGYWHLFNYVDIFHAYNNVFTNLFTRVVLAYFVLTAGFFAGQSNQNNSALGFYAKKVFRIFPLYLLAVVLFYWLGITGLSSSTTAIFLVSMFYPPVPITLWFITMIFIFYLLTPLLLLLFKRTNESPQALILISIGFVVMFYLYDVLTGLLDMRMLMYIYPYVIGVYISFFHKPDLLKTKNSHFIIILLLSLIIAYFFFDSSKLISSLSKIPLISIVALAAFRYSLKLSFKPKINYIAGLLSYVSFCVYLFHRVIFRILDQLYNKQGYFESETQKLLVFLFIGVPITILFSFVIQATYDFLYKKTLTWISKEKSY